MKKGLTLVELLITILILGIFVPLVMYLGYKSWESYNQLKQMTEDVLPSLSGSEYFFIRAYEKLRTFSEVDLNSMPATSDTIVGTVIIHTTSTPKVFQAKLVVLHEGEGVRVVWYMREPGGEWSSEELTHLLKGVNIWFEKNNELVQKFESGIVAVLERSYDGMRMIRKMFLPFVNVGISTR